MHIYQKSSGNYHINSMQIIIRLPFPRVNKETSLVLNPYFLFLKLMICGYSSGVFRVAKPFNHFPFTLPLKSQGLILIFGLFRSRLIFPVLDFVITKKFLPSITNQTGVITDIPFFLYVSRFM